MAEDPEVRRTREIKALHGWEQTYGPSHARAESKALFGFAFAVAPVIILPIALILAFVLQRWLAIAPAMRAMFGVTDASFAVAFGISAAIVLLAVIPAGIHMNRRPQRWIRLYEQFRFEAFQRASMPETDSTSQT